MCLLCSVKSVVIDCAPIGFLDAAGVKSLKQLVIDFDKRDVQVLFAAMTGREFGCGSTGSFQELHDSIPMFVSGLIPGIARFHSHIYKCGLIPGIAQFHSHIYECGLIPETACFHSHSAEENRLMMDRAKFYEVCGKEWLFPTIQDAIHHARFSSTLVREIIYIGHCIGPGCIYMYMYMYSGSHLMSYPW